MPLRTMTAGPIVALAAVTALAGCGGSSGPSKTDFVKKADAACEQVNREHPPKGPPKNAKEAVAQADEEIQIRTDLDKKLRGLDVPNDQKADFARYNAETQKIIGWIKLEGAAAKANDEKKYTQYSQGFQRSAGVRETVAVKLGFKVCGRRQPTKTQ